MQRSERASMLCYTYISHLVLMQTQALQTDATPISSVRLKARQFASSLICRESSIDILP